MVSSFMRPVVPSTARISRTARLSKLPFSTQRPNNTPFYRSRPALAATTLLVLGVPIGYGLGKSNAHTEPEERNKLGSLYDGSLNWKSKFVPPCTMDEVEAWLVGEQSVVAGAKGSGVKEWHSTRRPSNSPCEDTLVNARVQLPGSEGGGSEPWMFWGVFDGHVGGATSALLRESLVPYVTRSLSQLFQSPLQGLASNKDVGGEAVNETIKSTFKQLDDEILSDGIDALKSAKTHTEVLSRLAPGLAGACALLTIYDPARNLLRVASTGDCRAVLGSIDPDTKMYVATPLSIDQTGKNKAELERQQREHPGEEKFVNEENGRTLGLAPSRTFGDGVWKWPMEVVKEAHENFWSFKPRDEKLYLTPPYITAEPIITTTKIERKGEFMILATDGLWDTMSNEQAVKLVEMWLKAKKEGRFNVKLKTEPKKDGLALRIDYEKRRAKDEDFVVLDQNCATHLVRNALGGGNEEVICGIVGAPPSFSRDLRDDITVQVIFFDDN